MEVLLEMVVSNILVATGMAVVVAGLATLLRRPALLHCLWILVLLKLVTPPLVRAPIVPVDVLSFRAEVQAPAVPSPSLPVVGSPDPDEYLSQDEVSSPGPLLGEPRNTPVATASTSVSGRVRFGWIQGILMIWGLGSVVVFSLAWCRTWRFRRILRHAAPAPAAVQRRAGHLARRLGLSRCPGVDLVSSQVSPMMWALLSRPRLILPARLLDTVNGEELDSLLAHELAHVHRRDHHVRLLELLVVGLFWWFPVVWLVRRALRTVEEQCCDAWVIWSLPGQAEAYAHALVKTLEFLAGKRVAMPPVASGARPVLQLKRRLTMIMERTPPRMLSRTGRVAVLGLAVLMLSFLPTWAQESRESREKKIHGAQMKLERVERAMKELRAAGLRKEVEHLERVAQELRGHIDHLHDKCEPGKKVHADRGTLEKMIHRLERELVEMRVHRAHLEAEGMHEKAKEMEEKACHLEKKLEHHRQALHGAIKGRDRDDRRQRDAVIRRLDEARAVERELEEMRKHIHELAEAGDAERAEEVEQHYKHMVKRHEDLHRWLARNPDLLRRVPHDELPGRLRRLLEQKEPPVEQLERKREALVKELHVLMATRQYEEADRMRAHIEKVEKMLKAHHQRIEAEGGRKQEDAGDIMRQGFEDLEHQKHIIQVHQHALEKMEQMLRGNAHKCEELGKEVKKLGRLLMEFRKMMARRWAHGAGGAGVRDDDVRRELAGNAKKAVELKRKVDWVEDKLKDTQDNRDRNKLMEELRHLQTVLIDLAKEREALKEKLEAGHSRHDGRNKNKSNNL